METFQADNRKNGIYVLFFLILELTSLLNYRMDFLHQVLKRQFSASSYDSVIINLVRFLVSKN